MSDQTPSGVAPMLDFSAGTNRIRGSVCVCGSAYGFAPSAERGRNLCVGLLLQRLQLVPLKRISGVG